MIDRYRVAEIENIWSEENKFRRWLDVELAVTAAWVKLGRVPAAALKRLRQNARFKVTRIAEIERRVKHDVIAFLTAIEEQVGEDSAYLHMGITSYDIVDTALSLLLLESLAAVRKRAQLLADILRRQAFATRDLVVIGRTHGVHAEPITFGVKFLLWYEELLRNLSRLERAENVIAVGKVSGSVGTYTHFPPQGEEIALAELGLQPCRVTSQVIQRDRHAEVIMAIALLGTTLEKIAVEIRHLQRTEVLEAEEPFTAGQKGSSSMPHKRNPVRCERISGLARLLRGQVAVVLENNVLWHERDISHSSAERVLFPDCFHLAAFMLDDIADVVDHLHFYPEKMRKNLELTHGVFYSQKLLTLLVAKGMARQRAYELVQGHALKSWQQMVDFPALVQADKEITELCSRKELAEVFSEQALLAGVAEIFARFATAPGNKRAE